MDKCMIMLQRKATAEGLFTLLFNTEAGAVPAYTCVYCPDNTAYTHIRRMTYQTPYNFHLIPFSAHQPTIGLLNTVLYCTRIVSVFDCIYAISQNRPQNTPKKGRIQISYVNGAFTCILVQNPVYFGVKPNIFRRDTLYRRETLHILGVKPYICVKPHFEACKQAKKALTHLISQHSVFTCNIYIRK